MITVDSVDPDRMFGLSYGDPNQSYDTINFAMDLQSAAVGGGTPILRIHENGVGRTIAQGIDRTYAVGDVLKVQVTQSSEPGSGGLVSRVVWSKEHSGVSTVLYADTAPTLSYPLLLAPDPSARVKLVRTASMNKDGTGTNSKREGLTGPQVNSLLRQAQAAGEPERNCAILQVLLQTGIRLSECSSLRFGDITFGERSGMLLVRAGKGNKVRSVPLNASAREALTSYVAPRLGLGEGEGEDEKERDSLKALLKSVTVSWPKPGTPQSLEPLWLSRKGGALTSSAIGQMMAELVRAAGKLVPHETSVHSLRHTFARSYQSIYLGDVVGLATLLGHNSLDTTRLYSQPAASLLAGRVERLPLNAHSG